MNWMRRTVASTDAASARASIVLPTPGTSSMRRCPSASRQTREARTAAGFPSMTRETDVTIASVDSAKRAASIAVAVDVTSGMLLPADRGSAVDATMSPPNEPSPGGGVGAGSRLDLCQLSARRHPGQLPQDGNVARVTGLCRVRGESYFSPGVCGATCPMPSSVSPAPTSGRGFARTGSWPRRAARP